MVLRLAKRETEGPGVKECGQKKRRDGETGDFRPFPEEPHDQIGWNVTLNNVPLDERRVAGRYTMIQLERPQVRDVLDLHRESVLAQVPHPRRSTPSGGTLVDRHPWKWSGSG